MPDETPAAPAPEAKLFAHYRKSVFKNYVHYRKGQRIPFEALADSQGVIRLEVTKENESNIADLEEFVSKHIGGVSKISEAEYYDIKKNHPLPSAPSLKKDAPRLFEPASPVPGHRPADQGQTVPLVAAQGSASPAAAPAPATPALAQDGSELPPPISPGRKVNFAPRQGKPKGAGVATTPSAADVLDAVSESPATEAPQS